MIGQRLSLARTASGMSMEKLGTIVGVSANMIKKYEHDQSMPTSSMLLKLATALNTRIEFFFRPQKVTLSQVEFRKKHDTPVKLLKQIEADVIDQAERWLELSNLWANFPVKDFQLNLSIDPIHSLDDVEVVANKLREYWQLGTNPIPHLIDLLESKGILVIATNVIDDKNKFDGLQASVNNLPVIVVSNHWCGDRQRFTLAHELGHLILHDYLGEGIDEEQACNRFAGSFLLPKQGVIEHLGEHRKKISPKELSFLKHEYGLSMSACVHRAKDLGVINANYHKTMMIIFAKNGWRKQEPDTPYPSERTYLFKQLVYRALAEEIISESKGAELLKMSVFDLHYSQFLGNHTAEELESI